MRTPAQISGHPIHPMIVTIPIGLWIFSLVCDFIAMGSATPATWATASFYAMVGGIIGGLCAAVPGFVDLFSVVRRTPARSTGYTHMGLNLLIVVLYLINAFMRRNAMDVAPSGTPLVLSIVAIVLLLVSGWLGGKMVYEAGVAVHAGDTDVGAATDAWTRDRGMGRGSPAMPGVRMDHAMASDTARPARDSLREDRPSAGSSVETPRE